MNDEFQEIMYYWIEGETDPAELEIKEDKMSDTATIDVNNEDEGITTDKDMAVNWQPKSR